MNYQLGLIGFPIKHSLSPWIHENFLKRSQLNGNYSLLEINPHDSFSNAMTQLKKQNLNGFNVTVPFKEKIIPYIDELDELAERVGAVNTVLCKQGKWIGYNTDGIGYIRSLLDYYPEIKAMKNIQIMILGAGGAAKGIFNALIKSGFSHITIANRTIEKANEIISNNLSATNSRAISLKTAEEEIEQFDVIIQTSTVGMKPNVDKQIISLNKLKADAVVSDIVYQPLMTTFLAQAKRLGANIHFGHTMLLYQALNAFEIWTKETVDITDMELKLKQILEG